SRIARHANGAATACPSARSSASPGRRGNPEIENVSSSYPAAGTSCASARSGDPANVTWTPRARSASATASAGSTCPAVPPAAIRHRSCDSSIRRHIQEDADRRQLDDQVRAAVGDERQRDPGERRESQNGHEIDRRLTADERDETGREVLSEGVPARQRDAESGPREERVGEDHAGRADEPELLADDRQDHVRVRFREVVDLLDSLAEPFAEQPARAEPDLRLHDLEAAPLRVVPRVEEAEEAVAAVRLEPDRDGAEREREPARGAQHAPRYPGDEEQRRRGDEERDRRAEVGLDDDHGAEEAEHEAERLRELPQRLRRVLPR